MKSVSTVLTITALLGASLARPQSAASKPPPPPAKGSLPIDSFLDDIAVPPGPQPKGCADYEILLARGTGEPGPFGVIVGDPLVADVLKVLPKARGYAVNYPASSGKGSYETGAADLRNRLTEKSAECPDMKYALTGYSQGASVVRAAFQNWTDSAIQDKIVAVVLFGDPGLNQQSYNPVPKGHDPSLTPLPLSIYRKLREFCIKGDPVCSIGTDFAAHLSYNTRNISATAVDFIVKAFQGTPLPAKVDGAV